MSQRYPELDGVRLMDESGSTVWLVFHGLRHRVASPRAYDALFGEASRILLNPNLDDIEDGDPLDDDTCLVRFEELPLIFLATRLGGRPVLFHIATYETFVDFGFDEAKVRDLPGLFRDSIPQGDLLVSAPDRAAQT